MSSPVCISEYIETSIVSYMSHSDRCTSCITLLDRTPCSAGSLTAKSRPHVRLHLHGAIYRPDSFVLMIRYCANLKAIRYESTSLNRIVADKSHSVIVASLSQIPLSSTGHITLNAYRC